MHINSFSVKKAKGSYKEQIKGLLEVVQVPPIVVYPYRQNLHPTEGGKKSVRVTQTSGIRQRVTHHFL